MNDKKLIAKAVSNLKKAITKKKDDYNNLTYYVVIKTVINDKFPDKPTLYIEGSNVVIPYIGW
jgi:hypothetical protein